MRTSLLRLERQRTEDTASALSLMQRHYEELATALLLAARDRGYLGGDPLGAIESLRQPPPMDFRVCEQVGELWQVFFTTFRADEQQFEAARFQTAAAELNDRFAVLPEGQPPDIDLTLSMLDALVHFWEERQEALNQRLDLLIKDLGDHQQRLGSIDLQAAHQADELSRSTALVAAALRDLGAELQGDENLSDLLGLLVRRWREELQRRADDVSKRRQQLQDREQREHDFKRALQLAAQGKVPTDVALDGLDGELVAQVADVVAGHREQERLIADVEQEKAELLAELANKDQEIAQRDQLIARYEFEEADHGDEDRRLQLYRQAIAIWEQKGDPSEIVEQVRELERVLIIDAISRQRVIALLDRHLEGLSKTLGELRRIEPLAEDHRRFRPRLLAASTYDFKKLTGLMRAGRDACRDLLLYIARARWTAGALLIGRRLPRLRSIFREMVRYVGDCREHLGGIPPRSMSCDLGTLHGLASLPGALAMDVRALAKTRGAKRFLDDVHDVFDECVQRFHDLLEQARGERIPRSEAPKREAASKALDRLAGELLDLAGLLDTTFAEARDNDWQPGATEERLLEHEHLLLLGLRDADAICDVLRNLAGAPETELPALPSGRRSDLDGLLAGCKARCRWLEDIARYRVHRA